MGFMVIKGSFKKRPDRRAAAPEHTMRRTTDALQAQPPPRAATSRDELRQD
jgi:hypothetical protein